MFAHNWVWFAVTSILPHMLLIFILCLIASPTRSFLEECGGELRTLKLACCRYITKNTLATIGRVCKNLEGIFCTLGILESVMSLSCSKLCSKHWFKDFQPCIPFTTALILLMKVLGLKCVHNLLWILLNSSNLHDCNLAVSCLDLLDWHSHNGTVAWDLYTQTWTSSPACSSRRRPSSTLGSCSTSRDSTSTALRLLGICWTPLEGVTLAVGLYVDRVWENIAQFLYGTLILCTPRV